MPRSPRIETVLSAWTVALLVAGCGGSAPLPAPTPPPAAPTVTAAPQQPQAAQQPAEPAVVSTTPTDAPAAEPAAPAKPTEEAKPVAAFYSVGVYDEKRDPTVDLTETIRRAKDENKRILIQVGGEWCGWCHRISKYMETNEQVRPLVDEHFVVMKVTYPGEYAESFLAQYPRVEAYPHLFVLEPDGKFLHSQGTAELEFEQGYNDEVFVKFLNDWIL